MKYLKTKIILAVLTFSGCQTLPKSNPGYPVFRAGEDSFRFNIAISNDERRGEAPHQRSMDVKKEIAELLNTLRTDGTCLKHETELNIESYFTVADAFEADGLLIQSVDCLNDLRCKLRELVDARTGRKNPYSLIETEDDILHYRDSHNIHVIDEKYLAGAQPSEKGYQWLKSKGVTTIVNLRLPNEHEKNLVESLGLEYVHIPWADERAPTMAQIRMMLDTVKNSQGRVFQHCLRGIGRDMTMAGCYKIAVHGESASRFIAEVSKEAPRWESDQKRDVSTNEPVQFKLLREFEREWKGEKK